MSCQASTTNSARPSASGVSQACQWSLPKARIGTRRQSLSPAWRQSSAAAIWSWPSVKITAPTSSASFATHLAAKRPPSTWGVTDSMAMRGALAARMAWVRASS